MVFMVVEVDEEEFVGDFEWWLVGYFCVVLMMVVCFVINVVEFLYSLFFSTG